MSDVMHLIAGSYDDFKTIIGSLPSKTGLLFWSNTIGTNFQLTGFTKDLKVSVQFGPDGSTPSTLLADFPDAINIPDSNPANWAP